MAFPTGKMAATHKEAVEVLITIPSSYSDIDEQLSNVHAEQKIKHRQALFQILSCL